MKSWIAMLAVVSLTACSGSAASREGSEAVTPSGTGSAATSGGAPEASSAPEAERAREAPRVREITIPEGTTLRLRLRSAVASDSSRVEDVVRAELREAVRVNGEVVLPAGTELVGTVTAVERSGRVKGRARVAYRFTSLYHDGVRYDLRAAPLSHVAPATKKKDAAKIATGAGAGAVVGAIVGGGDGAAKGAAIGGAAGTGVVLATRGEEVRLGPGAAVTTRLTAPLTVRIPARESAR